MIEKQNFDGPLVHSIAGSRSTFDDPVLAGIQQLLSLKGLNLDPEVLRYGTPLEEGRVTFEQLPELLLRLQVAARIAVVSLDQIGAALLPCLVMTGDGQSLVLTAIGAGQCRVVSPVTGGDIELTRTELEAMFDGRALFAHPRDLEVRRAGNYARCAEGHWFRSKVAQQWKRFLEVALASLLAALLSVATALFAMQVYDRVVPTQATETLWALGVGVFIAVLFEFLLRSLRAQLIEGTGKRIDLALSRELFDHAIHLKLAAKPGSTGAFASQMRDFEVVREFFTASTLGACGDLPFTLLFIALIAAIGGPLAWIPAAAIIFMVLPSLLVQPVVSRMAREGMEEAAVKNAVLLETIDHMETVKANRAEGRALGIWQRLSAEQGARGVNARTLSAWLGGWAQAMQQAGYIATIIGGVYLIFAGELTVGALIACSILTSRAVSPMAQVAGLLARWQQVKVALEGLEDMMSRPVERPVNRQFVRLPGCRGDYEFSGVRLQLEDEAPPVLDMDNVRIGAGQRWALLGGNGAGKSSLLRLLAGIYDASAGSVLLDGLDISQVEPADKRRLISYMPQDIVLFHGTLRDNLGLDGRGHSDARLQDVLDMAGLGAFVRRHPRGLDMFIPGNQSLSGGQRQAIGLARLILQDAPIVLLDEPTASLDQSTENTVIQRLRPWLAGRTVVIATHKMPLLSLCDQALVLQGGKPLLHGSVDAVLQRLNTAAGDNQNNKVYKAS